MGLDFGGLTKDLFTSLWNAAYDEYFEGETVKVPFARPHQQLQVKAVFQKFGRILYHGYSPRKSQFVSVRHPLFAYFMEKSLLTKACWRGVFYSI